MTSAIAFDEQGLVPAVVQAAETGEVLMVAWMNDEAVRKTLETRRTHFWSRSRQVLWEKGETSGHRQHVEAVYGDCDRDTLLVLVHQEGVACHTGSRTCFFTRLDGPGAAPGEWAAGSGILETVERVIQARKVERPEGSYVARLLAKGDPGVLKKIGEEAAEVIIAAKNGDPAPLANEAGDLIYHLLVMLRACDVPLDDVLAVLEDRRAGK